MIIGALRPEEAKTFNDFEGHHRFVNEDGEEFGSLEIFWANQDDLDLTALDYEALDDGEEPMSPGWYWWPCFPGCLPDGEAMGPFSSSRDARDDAREDFDYA